MVQPEFRLQNLGSQAVLLLQGQKAQGSQYMNGPVLLAAYTSRDGGDVGFDEFSSDQVRQKFTDKVEECASRERF
ncbi:hypothetical protein LEMLEM_LOCUS10117 [Lemmus lemmus]